MPFIAYFAQTFFLGIVKKFYYKHKLQKWLNSKELNKQSLGFVPTMGALHEGHMSLIEAANNTCNLTIASIFVNPKQFDKEEDLLNYPRTEEQDSHFLEENECDMVYIPSKEDLYDDLYEHVNLNLQHLANVYEGEKREGHFEGVIQVLYQLFDIIKPTDVFFGQKDFQQCLVVKSILHKYFPGIKMHTVPTFRDSEGLALSSRNKRLSEVGIQKAQHFNKGLKQACDTFNEGTQTAINKAKIYLASFDMEVEYLDFANAENLQPCADWKEIPKNIVVVSAVWLEGIRLIDNMVFKP